MKNKILMAFLAMSFAGAMAQASGHGVGNGGDGLMLDTRSRAPQMVFTDFSAETRGWMRERMTECLPAYIELTEKALVQVTSKFGETYAFEQRFGQYSEADYNQVQSIFEALETEYQRVGGCVDTEFARSRDFQSLRDLTASIGALWNIYNLAVLEQGIEDAVLNPHLEVLEARDPISLAIAGGSREGHCALVIKSKHRVAAPQSASDFELVEQCD